MSTTRLLVLGVTQIFQPAHGYAIRRELLSWHAEQWANVNPGSVYNALRSLTRDGYLQEETEGSSGTGPSRTTYRLTLDGENEFLRLLREALWEVDSRDPSYLLAGLAFMTVLRRDEVVDAFAARRSRLRTLVTANQHAVRHSLESGLVPAFTAEMFRVTTARIEGELAWAEAFGERLAEGHYVFRDEPGWPVHPVDGRWPALAPAPAQNG